MILLMIRHAKRVTQGVLRCKIAGHAACGAHMTLSGFSISEGALIRGCVSAIQSHVTRHASRAILLKAASSQNLGRKRLRLKVDT
jgi:hypothetical protein